MNARTNIVILDDFRALLPKRVKTDVRNVFVPFEREYYGHRLHGQCEIEPEDEYCGTLATVTDIFINGDDTPAYDLLNPSLIIDIQWEEARLFDGHPS